MRLSVVGSNRIKPLNLTRQKIAWLTAGVATALLSILSGCNKPRAKTEAQRIFSDSSERITVPTEPSTSSKLVSLVNQPSSSTSEKDNNSGLSDLVADGVFYGTAATIQGVLYLVGEAVKEHQANQPPRRTDLIEELRDHSMKFDILVEIIEQIHKTFASKEQS